MINPFSTDPSISKASPTPAHPAIATGMKRTIVMALILLVCSNGSSAAVVEDRDWALAEVERGARTMKEVFDRRLEYRMTYRFARGALAKNVHAQGDTRGSRLGAHLALVWWLVKLPEDVDWRPTALAQYRDVSRWMAQEAPIDLAQVAHTVAVVLQIGPPDERWLLGILRGDPAAAATPALPATPATQYQ